jgi:hypothetical protein
MQELLRSEFEKSLGPLWEGISFGTALERPEQEFIVADTTTFTTAPQ